MWNAKLLDRCCDDGGWQIYKAYGCGSNYMEPVKVTVEDRNKTLYVHDTKRTTLTVQRHALYRKLNGWQLAAG